MPYTISAAVEDMSSFRAVRILRRTRGRVSIQEHKKGQPQASRMQHSPWPVIGLDTEESLIKNVTDKGESSPQHVNDASKSLEYSVKVTPPDRKAGYQVTSIQGENICGC